MTKCQHCGAPLTEQHQEQLEQLEPDRWAEMRAKLAEVRDHLQLYRLAAAQTVQELEATRLEAQKYIPRVRRG